MFVRVIVAIGGLVVCLVAGCVKPLSLEDRSCPCLEPTWVCCQSICVPRDRAGTCSGAGASSEPEPVPDAAVSSPAPDAGRPLPHAREEEPDAAQPEEPDAAEPGEPDALPPSVSFTLPPEGGTVSGTVRLHAVSQGTVIETLEVWVDGAIRNRVTGGATSVDWLAFRETLGAHSQAAHRLELVASDQAGNRYQKATTVRVVAPLRGDCDSNGVLDGSDIAAAIAEASDGDAGDAESTPEGTFPGSPACDANDDNVVDMEDATCINGLYYGPPGFSCVAPDLPAVRTILFMPREYHHLASDSELAGFMRDKVEEVRRYVARHNRGRTFRALPVEVFRAPQARSYYFQFPSTVYENVLSEFLLGYVEPTNHALTPWNRAVWVIVMGGSDFVESRRYANGHSYALVGDAHLYAARDLDCGRVNPVTPDDQVHQTCRTSWQGSSRIYGHAMGRAARALLAALGAPLIDPSSPDHDKTLMGDYTRYPEIGLSDTDRAVLHSSHFFPGSRDILPAVASVLSPAAGAAVSGMVEIRAAARDDYGVKNVDLFIDGRQVHPMDGSWCPESDNCARSPFEGDVSAVGMVYGWDTAASPPGPHSITFRVEDVSGNRSEAQATVTVQR
jgi:hypothetical protein